MASEAERDCSYHCSFPWYVTVSDSLVSSHLLCLTLFSPGLSANQTDLAAVYAKGSSSMLTGKDNIANVRKQLTWKVREAAHLHRLYNRLWHHVSSFLGGYRARTKSTVAFVASTQRGWVVHWDGAALPPTSFMAPKGGSSRPTFRYVS